MSGTALTLNLLFAVVGLLVAVGIPAAGIVWQTRGEQYARRMREVRARAMQRPSSMRQGQPWSGLSAGA